MKKRSLSIIVLLLFAFFAAGWVSADADLGRIIPGDSTATFSPPEADTVIIAGAGDVMLGTIVPSRTFLPANEDCSGLLAHTAEYFLTSDVAFCNLEGVFTDTPAGQKTCKNPESCWIFGMPTKFVQCLVDAGFDLISVANNHTRDFGETGKQTTAKTLENAGLKFAGWLTHPTAIYENNGIRFGFCAFSPERGNCDIRNYDEAKRIVAGLDSICDIVIVSFHSGAEGPKHQHVPKNDEMFMGYNRGNVHRFAHDVIDAGADVVFGHGPHVTRAVEVYNDRFIAYSLGNFCTYSRINVLGVCGLAPIVRVYTDKQGKFYKAQIISTYQVKYQPPRVDPDKKVLKIIRDLTKTNFPEANIHIDDDGWVTQIR
jgi:poly-gamma-glutamate capsule biosynthesis protein CapA/YwtB (metallophosphatase superfamily)